MKSVAIDDPFFQGEAWQKSTLCAGSQRATARRLEGHTRRPPGAVRRMGVTPRLLSANTRRVYHGPIAKQLLEVMSVVGNPLLNSRADRVLVVQARWHHRPSGDCETVSASTQMTFPQTANQFGRAMKLPCSLSKTASPIFSIESASP